MLSYYQQNLHILDMKSGIHNCPSCCSLKPGNAVPFRCYPSWIFIGPNVPSTSPPKDLRLFVSPSWVGKPQRSDQDAPHLFPSAPVRSGQTCLYRPRASELNNVRTSQEVAGKTSFMPEALSLTDRRETSANPRSPRRVPFHRHQSPGK